VLQKQTRKQKSYYSCKRQGLCTECYALEPSGEVRCRLCKAKVVARHNRRRAAGLCMFCGKVAMNNLVRCEACARRKSAQARVENDKIKKPLCRRCALIRVNLWPTETACWKCRFGASLPEIRVYLAKLAQRQRERADSE